MENKCKSFDIHHNIDSLLDTIDQQRFIAEKGKPSLIGITESATETEFDIDGYTTFFFQIHPFHVSNHTCQTNLS